MILSTTLTVAKHWAEFVEHMSKSIEESMSKQPVEHHDDAFVRYDADGLLLQGPRKWDSLMQKNELMSPKHPRAPAGYDPKLSKTTTGQDDAVVVVGKEPLQRREGSEGSTALVEAGKQHDNVPIRLKI